METLSGVSLDLTEYNLHQLKELFPEVFCEDKIDFETEGGNDRLFLCVKVYIG